MISEYQLFKACPKVQKRLFCPTHIQKELTGTKLTVILLLLSAVLNGSKGSLEDCLKKQSAAKGSEPLKGSPPKGSER